MRFPGVILRATYEAHFTKLTIPADDQTSYLTSALCVRKFRNRVEVSVCRRDKRADGGLDQHRRRLIPVVMSHAGQPVMAADRNALRQITELFA